MTDLNIKRLNSSGNCLGRKAKCPRMELHADQLQLNKLCIPTSMSDNDIVLLMNDPIYKNCCTLGSQCLVKNFTVSNDTKTMDFIQLIGTFRRCQEEFKYLTKEEKVNFDWEKFISSVDKEQSNINRLTHKWRLFDKIVCGQTFRNVSYFNLYLH